MADASTVGKPRVIGRPFEKGNHQGGRPKIPDELKEAFKALAPKALEVLQEIMIQGDKNADRVKAAEVILDRGWGKPLQQIDANVTERKPLTYDPAHEAPDSEAK